MIDLNERTTAPPITETITAIALTIPVTLCSPDLAWLTMIIPIVVEYLLPGDNSNVGINHPNAEDTD